MKKNIITKILLALSLPLFFIFSCTKYEKGFLSPFVQYTVNEFTIMRGSIATSNILSNDGSTNPLHVKLIHIYDSTGKIVDDLFSKKYPVKVWTAGFLPTSDTTYSSVSAKIKADSLPPIIMNENTGSITSTSSSINLPLGTFTVDIEISNSIGTETLKNAMKIIIADAPFVDFSSGNIMDSLISITGNTTTNIYSTAKNPFIITSFERIEDTSNLLTLKFVDKNNIPFNPKSGEITRKLNIGYNPPTPYRQSLRDFSVDSYSISDSTMSIKIPITPFPVAPINNTATVRYNQYYVIKSSAATIDSTLPWTSNVDGVYYQGVSDSHYAGTYTDGEYDYLIRFPMQIKASGSYKVTLKILNVTHK